MTIIYSVLVIGLFCSAVMVWKARYNITTSYAASRKVFTDAQDCITNSQWANVLTKWIAHTNFNDFAVQLMYCVWIFVVMLLIAVVFAIYALMATARRNTV